MKPRLLLIAYAVVASISCLVLLLKSDFYVFTFRGSAAEETSLLISYIGSLYGGLATIAWFSRDAKPDSGLYPVSAGLTVANVLGASVAIACAISGKYNEASWVAAIFQIAFAIGFATICLRRRLHDIPSEILRQG